MKTIELSTGTLLVVDRILYEIVGVGIRDEFNYLGHPSEITGEVWGKVVELYPACSDCYKDYSGHVFGDDASESPTQSGISLCAAHNIQESDVLLFKSKNS
jgi:hypothetical protein